MPYSVSIDKDVCISSGKCVADAPTAFRFDADEISHAIGGASAIDERALIAVARNCPSGAIRVLDGDTTIPVD